MEVFVSDGSRPIHPLWLRVTHWLNALAVVILVMSGWRIYPVRLSFCRQYHPGWLARRCAAVAFRGHVASRGQRHGLSAAQPR